MVLFTNALSSARWGRQEKLRRSFVLSAEPTSACELSTQFTGTRWFRRENERVPQFFLPTPSGATQGVCKQYHPSLQSGPRGALQSLPSDRRAPQSNPPAVQP